MRHAGKTSQDDRSAARRGTAARLLRRRDGASAVEFVLIFPIMISLLAGTIDFGQALMLTRKLNLVASRLGDMVSQKSTWTTSDVEAIMAGTALIVSPFDTSELEIQLAVVDIDDDLDATVNWAKAYNGTALSHGADSPVDIPEEIAQSGVQLIAVNATFTLETPFASLFEPLTGVTAYSFSKKYIMRPRIKDTVALN
ncbi:pilus assembly protein [Rhizobium sp. TRM95111]|uniref:TadE/TadG family type IV pilus assembly protein n=1 Tax=Rhizobium alarense TaxID=2846851 RepID=UPI001F476136|nr:TadE/TadG family type IV pilus assembly protein [Rhizobium alarense]MCF3642781.1 pilus assembly protein [Rhizobium alarense]